MMAVLTEVEIVFENVEAAKLDSKFIEKICVSGTKILRLTFAEILDEKTGKKGLETLKGIDAERIFIKISKSARGLVTSNGDEIFERICRFADITSLDLKYSDGTEENICADWEDATAGGEENLLQKSYFDDEKNLVIEIGKSKEN